jgi:hypothetical protein
MSSLVTAVLVSVIAPVVYALITGYVKRTDDREQAAIRREEKEQDWARQDVVAAKVDAAAKKAAETAKLLEAAQAVSIAAAEEVARLAAHNAKTTDTQLSALKEVADHTQTLVNSNLYAEMLARLGFMKGLHTQMQTTKTLAERTGDPTEEIDSSMEILSEEIEVLTEALADRRKQTELAERGSRLALETEKDKG